MTSVSSIRTLEMSTFNTNKMNIKFGKDYAYVLV